jgi:hypothetical protein
MMKVVAAAALSALGSVGIPSATVTNHKPLKLTDAQRASIERKEEERKAAAIAKRERQASRQAKGMAR